MSLNEKIRRYFSTREWIVFFVGLLVSTAWFLYSRSIDFLPYPNQADAVSYSQISDSFTGFWQAFTYADTRTFGFPFVLYVLKEVVELFFSLSPEGLVAVQTSILFSFHLVCSVIFYRALRIHPLFLLLLLIHPGLIGHTSVLLTDTFAANLFMLVIVLILGARSGDKRLIALRGAGAGILMGFAVGTRPFLITVLVSMSALWILVSVWSRAFRKLSHFFIPFFTLAIAILLPAVSNCRTTFGKTCLQNPEFAAGAAAGSLQIGLTSPRMYWAMRSPWESMTVIPLDTLLSEKYGSACDIEKILGPSDWIECVLKRPLLIPVYAVKKGIAVFDNYLVHPYTTDVNPSWVRKYNRIFGALSFTGFFFLVGMFAFQVRRRNAWEAMAWALPIVAMIFQLPMHVEGRYSLPAVPLCHFALFWVFHNAQTRKQTLSFLLVALVLSGAFIAQTHAWDLNDFVLQQIEGWQ